MKKVELANVLDQAAGYSAQVFFEKLAVLTEMDLDFDESACMAERFRDFLNRSPSELFLKALSSEGCPDFLGIHAAKFGRIEHQVAYLFGSQHDVDAYVARVRLRSNVLKKMFLQRGLLAVLRLLFKTDTFSYLMWAQCLGFPGTRASDEYPGEIVDIVQAERIVRDWLDGNLYPIYRKMSDDYFKNRTASRETLTYHGWIFENLGQMGWDLHHNGWGNGYGFLAREIQNLLSEKAWGMPALLRKTMQIDASILIGNHNRRTACYLYTDVEEDALSRLEDVVAFWCTKEPRPIEYRKNNSSK